MKIRIVTIGKLRASPLRGAIEDYRERVEKKMAVDLLEIESEKISPKPKTAEINFALEKEAARLAKYMTPERLIIALTPSGKTEDSIAFSQLLASFAQTGKNEVVFLIGGAFGLHPSVLQKATRRLSLSPLTFSHELALLVLLEQIYRGFSILDGLPYHK